MRNRSLSFTTVAAVALLLGCGGGESTGETGTVPVDANTTEAAGGGAETGTGTGGASNSGGAGGASGAGTAGSEIVDATTDFKSPLDSMAPKDAAIDVPSVVDAGTCRAIGADCADVKCAASLECVDLNVGNACAPKHAMCGGIVAMECPNDAPKCVYLSGDVGICLTQPEMNCFCNKVGGRAAGCGV